MQTPRPRGVPHEEEIADVSEMGRQEQRCAGWADGSAVRLERREISLSSEEPTEQLEDITNFLKAFYNN